MKRILFQWILNYAPISIVYAEFSKVFGATLSKNPKRFWRTTNISYDAGWGQPQLRLSTTRSPPLQLRTLLSELKALGGNRTCYLSSLSWCKPAIAPTM